MLGLASYLSAWMIPLFYMMYVDHMALDPTACFLYGFVDCVVVVVLVRVFLNLCLSMCVLIGFPYVDLGIGLGNPMLVHYDLWLLWYSLWLILMAGRFDFQLYVKFRVLI